MTSTLPSLRNQSAKEIEGILANLTLEMVPNPGIGGRVPYLPADIRERLEQEIRIGLGLKRDDKSPQAMSRIYSYLAREMSGAALQGVDINEVKKRLGEKGGLPPPLYKIEFMGIFRDLSERRGVEKRDVERTLQAPDLVEHLRPELLGIATAKNPTSLYLKEFRNHQRPSNTYSLLVFCRRDGYTQRVNEAWMIFHSDIDLRGVKTPLDVLKAFVSKYGIEIQVGEKTGRFFWHEHVTVHPDKGVELIRFVRPATDVLATAATGERVDNKMEIIYAFAVNQTAYDADLVKHGIRIKPPKRQPSSKT